MDQLMDYRERSLAILADAQVFRIDLDAYWMMSELVNEMKRDGLDELFSQVQLPFPTMVIMPPLVGADGMMRQNDGSVSDSSHKSMRRSTLSVSPFTRTPSAQVPTA